MKTLAYNYIIKYILAIQFMCFGLCVGAQVNTIEKFSDFEERYIIEQSKDSIYVINFWATWCAPCIKELPYFQELDRSTINNKKVRLTLVSLDLASTLESRLLPFLEKRKIQNEVVLLADEDANYWIDQVDTNWSGAIPATLIIYNNHKYFFEKSYNSTDQIIEEIRKISNNN